MKAKAQNASDWARVQPENIRPIVFSWDEHETETFPLVGPVSVVSGVRTTEASRNLERAMGIEPTSEAWEVLYQTLKAIDLAALNVSKDGSNWKLNGN